MGSWGYAPMSNDTSEDIRDEFETKLKYKKDFDIAIKEILTDNKDILDDKDDASNLWLALADRQWQYGFKNNKIKTKVKEICQNGIGQNLWKEEGSKEYLKRMNALEKFYNKISIPKKILKKIPKLVIRKAIFKKGDCLSLKLDNGYYACALVLDEDNSDIEYGDNFIVLLQSFTQNKPTLDLFYNTPYLIHTLSEHNKGKIVMSGYGAIGFKKFKTQIEKIGNINISSTNFTRPMLCSYSEWNLLITEAENEFKEEYIIL